VRVWYGQLAGSAFPLFIYSIFGLLLAVVWSYIGMLSALLVLAPLAVARWVFAEFALRQEAYEATMRSLIKSVETKDLYTRGHSERVSRASVLIGRSAGMREDRVSSLRYAGMLHDVGKLGVPTSVLQKAGRLTDDEYEAIQQHTVRGREIVKDLEFLGEAIEGILLHHERIDGRGYPMGKVGSEIPEFARIIAVADAFDSMTTTRSYRGARSIEDAFAELVDCKGSQFDPVMVDALIAAIEAKGWDASDTLPVNLPAPNEGVPTMASDDDDPTVATHLGIPSAAPNDASELDGDSLGETVGGDRP
jgi:HD-GYP domain-containing protein (c-di-GMP phosphodiesterase class II)